MIELYPCGNRTHCQNLDGTPPDCDKCPHNSNPQNMNDCNTCKYNYEKKEDDEK
jgi:hypothetical protein